MSRTQPLTLAFLCGSRRRVRKSQLGEIRYSREIAELAIPFHLCLRSSCTCHLALHCPLSVNITHKEDPRMPEYLILRRFYWCVARQSDCVIDVCRRICIPGFDVHFLLLLALQPYCGSQAKSRQILSIFAAKALQDAEFNSVNGIPTMAPNMASHASIRTYGV